MIERIRLTLKVMGLMKDKPFKPSEGKELAKAQEILGSMSTEDIWNSVPDLLETEFRPHERWVHGTCGTVNRMNERCSKCKNERKTRR